MDLSIAKKAVAKALKQSAELVKLSITFNKKSLQVTITPVRGSEDTFNCEAMFNSHGGTIVFIEGTITKKGRNISVTITEINIASRTERVNEAFCFAIKDQ